MLFGLIHPDAGAVELLGRPFDGLGGGALEEVGGFVEEPAFYPYLSGRANLASAGKARRRPERGRGRARARTSGPGAQRGEDRVAGYSTGMRQRLGLAAALLRSPRLLLLDEPTSGLDPAGTRAVAALVRELAAEGVAVLLSSHQIGELERVCDAYTVLREGRVVWDGSAAELVAQAPASAYALATSDDEQALRIAAEQVGVRAGRSRRGELALAVARGLPGRVRVRARGRARGDPPPRSAREPAGGDVLRPDLRRRPARRAGARGTGRDGAGRAMSAIAPKLAAAAASLPLGGEDPIWNAFRTELQKLGAQLTSRLLGVVCIAGPFAFAAVLKVQSGTPSDALFGAWVHSSGFAISLVILGFAGTWGFPLIAGLLGGDLFASEDRHGTWKTILTRSCTRSDLYAGKLLAAGTLAVALTLLLALSSVLAGVLLVGAHSLVDLSGVLTSPGGLLGLTVLSWLLCLLPVLAYTSVAILFSVATRNGIIGVLGPLLVALLTQLLDLIGKGVGVHLLLIGSAFDGWHGLFTTHRFYGPLVISSLVSVAWIAACVTASWRILRRRDFLASTVSRGPDWRTPVRVVAVATARGRRARPARQRRPHGRHRPPPERGDRRRVQQPDAAAAAADRAAGAGRGKARHPAQLQPPGRQGRRAGGLELHALRLPAAGAVGPVRSRPRSSMT